MLKLSMDEFDKQFKPVQHDDGGQTFSYEETLDVNTDYVWTLLDSDQSGNVNALPGYGTGGYGYCITEVPWNTLEIEAVWIDARDL